MQLYLKQLINTGNLNQTINISLQQYDNAKYEYAVGDYVLVVLVDYPTSDNNKGAPNKLLTNRKGPTKMANKNGDHHTLL
jgi:hypothetical protein